MGALKHNKSSVPKYPGLVERLMEVLGVRTQLDVASRLGITGPSVTDWKTRGGISTDMLVEVARMTGASIHWLLLGEGPKYIPGLRPGGDVGDLEARVRWLERTLVSLELEPTPQGRARRAALTEAQASPSLTLAVWGGLMDGRDEVDIARECGVEPRRVREVVRILRARRQAGDGGSGTEESRTGSANPWHRVGLTEEQLATGKLVFIEEAIGRSLRRVRPGEVAAVFVGEADEDGVTYVYFSPAASVRCAQFLTALVGKICDKPAREGLSLLYGKAAAWELLD